MSPVRGVTRAVAVTTRAWPAMTEPAFSSTSASGSAVGLMTAMEFWSRFKRSLFKNLTRAFASSSVRRLSP